MNPLFFQNSAGTREGTPADFLELTGAQWITQMRGSPSSDEKSYQRSRSDTETQSVLREAYGEFLSAPPPLVIREGAGRGQHVLCAFETIEKGKIVTEYLGEWLPNDTVGSAYRWGPIEGKAYRNCGAMIEDGFPNVVALYLYNVNGFPLRVVFVAIEEIAAGDLLAVNYGMSHSVKLGPHTEYRADALIRHFEGFDWEREMATLRLRAAESRIHWTWSTLIETEGAITKVQYLFHTPSSLKLFIDNQPAAASALFAQFDRLDNRLYLLGFPVTATARHREVLAHIQQIRQEP